MNQKRLIVEIAGWYGAVAILLAYGLVSFSLVASASLGYQLLNLTGALGLVVNSLFKKDYPPVALNAVWMLIAVIALLQMLR
jgi:hypothetical protein